MNRPPRMAKVMPLVADLYETSDRARRRAATSLHKAGLDLRSLDATSEPRCYREIERRVAKALRLMGEANALAEAACRIDARTE